MSDAPLVSPGIRTLILVTALAPFVIVTHTEPSASMVTDALATQGFLAGQLPCILGWWLSSVLIYAYLGHNEALLVAPLLTFAVITSFDIEFDENGRDVCGIGCQLHYVAVCVFLGAEAMALLSAGAEWWAVVLTGMGAAGFGLVFFVSNYFEIPEDRAAMQRLAGGMEVVVLAAARGLAATAPVRKSTEVLADAK